MSRTDKSTIKRNPTGIRVYLIGAGIGSLAAAVYLIRDAGVRGNQITIYEALDIPGGSLDGSGDAEKGYMVRGGRMLNIPTYECLQDLMSYIPSLEFDGISLEQEFLEFNEEFKTKARARLVRGDGSKVDVSSMGFNAEDRIRMTRLITEKEEALGEQKINEYFSPHFFSTSFWYMWQTTFAFQPWSSVVELKRYMIRFMHEFSRIHTLEGVARTQYNQYESIVLPIKTWLEKQGVTIQLQTRVTDIAFEDHEGSKVVSRLFLNSNGEESTIAVGPEDIVTFTNGSMTDNSSEGETHTTTALNRSENAPSFSLWKKLANGRPEFGRPEAFCGDVDGSMWMSFTVTINDNPALFNYIERFTRNHPGGGALVTFRDSTWLLSIVVAHQPHFRNQPVSTQIFWGYSLYPDRQGDYVKKPMLDCTGMEIVEELLYHLKAIDRKDEMTKNLICRTCVMPYITSQFMPRKPGDRPLVNPDGYENLAFISQFAEQPLDVVFTVEYSVRAAQRAVYYLMGVNKPLTPVTRNQLRPEVLMHSFLKLHS